MAVSILLLLANIGLAGRYGAAVSGALFGTFGLTAYLVPFLIFFGFAFYVANRSNPFIVRKLAGTLLMFPFLAAFLQLLTIGYSRRTGLLDHYRVSMAERTGGGIVGGALIAAFGYAFGLIGAYVLTVFGLIVAAIIMTQKPLLSTLGRNGSRAAREARERRRAISREKRELRKEQLAKGEATAREAHIRQIEKEAKEREKELERRQKEREKQLEQARSAQKQKQEREQERLEANPLDLVTLERPQPESVTFVGGAAGAPAKTASAPETDGFTMPSFLHADASRDTQGEFPAFRIEGLDGNDGLNGSDGMEAKVPEAEPFAVNSSPASNASRTDAAKRESGAPAENAEKKQAAGPDVSADAIADEIAKAAPEKPVYELPPMRLLSKGKSAKVDSESQLMATASKLQQTLQNFGVNVRVVNVSRGPTVTRYELQPEQGVKVSRIVNLQDDIKLNLATSEIRIEAPIPGKAAVGIEVPNREIAPVMLRDIIDCPEFLESKATLAFAVGKDIGGRPVITDIEKMPHLLIAGATGSGKSVCINTLIMSILYKSTPDQVKMLMIDPKVVELKIYDGIPHLLIPVVTDAKKAAGALNWAVQEMTERYNKFASYPGVRDIRSYNQRIEKLNAGLDEASRIPSMPRIVVIVDELADLMMVASSEVEDAICRLAQLARAAGIHLIIATQRPSVNVVTGLIKANMPSRIALAVTSGIDSRTILDMNGAEKLLGKGDMLFYPQGYPKPARVQGGYVSDSDITEVVNFLTSQSDEVEYNKEVEEQIESGASSFQSEASGQDEERDEYFADSGRLIIEKEKASIGMLQRAFKIGFNRAARIMDQLSEAGVVGGEEGTKPRKILMTSEEFEALLGAQGT